MKFTQLGLMVFVASTLLSKSFAAATGNEDLPSYQTLSHRMVSIDAVTAEARKEELIGKIRGKEIPDARKEQLIGFVEQCSQSLLLRFYMVNGGPNGPLTEFMTLYPEDGKITGRDPMDNPITEPDRIHFENAPVVLAYQANHRNVRAILNETIFESCSKGARELKFASVACGTFYEFLKLSYPSTLDLKLFGFDIDQESLDVAQANAHRHGYVEVTFKKQDAWQPLEGGPFDIITCNGFTFYIGEDDRLEALFKNFYDSLEIGGKAIASFILPTDQWNLTSIPEATMARMSLMMEAIPSRWTASFRSEEKMREILTKAGFSADNISFKYEPLNLHPSVIAKK